MDYQYITNALLLQVFIFIGWSCFLYFLTLAATRFLPELVKWSLFWQACLLVALAPFLPVSFYMVNDLIPAELKSAVIDSQNDLIVHSSSLVNQIVNMPKSQVFLNVILTALIIGCVYSLIRFFLGVLRLKKFVTQAAPVRELTQFSQQQKVTIKAKNIKVCITNQAISPFVFGFFRVKMLLPKYVFSMPPHLRFLLIEHELMHIKRRDTSAVITFRLCSSLFWFNPFICFIEKRFLQTMELNCDAAVLSAHPESKLHYAQALIASIKLSKTTIDSAITSYFSGPSLKKQDFEYRIRMAMSVQSRKVYGLGYRLILILVSSLFMLFAATAKSGLYPQEFYHGDNAGTLPVLHGRISSGYNEINDFRGRKPHKGIDFAAAHGTDVVASFSGRVTIADDSSLHKNYGKVVLIKHKNNKHSLYAHLDSFNVKEGQWIVAGQKLGTVGVTGRVTGPHLHFEILQGGKRIDPSIYLSFR